MSKGKILIVDDEPEIVRAVSMRLKASGFEIISAMDGLQATTMAMKEQPDVIILDIGMPAGDGHTVVKRLRNSTATCNIPIIFLTARTSERDFQKALKQGVDKYITKPFDSEELIAAIDELLSKSKQTSSIDTK